MTRTAEVSRPATAALIACALLAAAAAYGGYNAWIGLDADDSENLETTRVLASARILTDGPAGLYGPHSGANPYVLIQAPLYYQATAWLARPLAALGVGPIDACLAAGRLIAFLSLIACLGAAVALARLDGGSARAGAWAALLVVASPIIGSYPVAMRPDMPGVALQTVGLWLALRVALGGRAAAPWPSLLGAFAAFGLAACMKQHFFAVAGLSTALLAVEVARGRLRPAPLAASVGLSVLIVAASYGYGQAMTGGRMIRAVFAIPRELGRVAGGSWAHVALVASTTIRRSIGLAILAAACLAAGGLRAVRGRLEGIVALAVGADLALMAKMCLDSEGAWYNYAMQSAVLGAVVVGRALDRIVRTEARPLRLAVVGLGVLAMLGATGRLVLSSVSMRLDARDDLRRILDSPAVAAVPPESRFFVGLSQHNRRFGRPGLAHDEWLYGSYEALSAAEPRERWLRPALVDGPVRLVVTPEDDPEVHGLSDRLPALGYRKVDRAGAFDVWLRPVAPPRWEVGGTPNPRS